MRFQEERQIGEGTYGKVFAVRCPATNELLALKKVPCEPNYGIPLTTIREINMLKAVKHPNIIPLLETFSQNNTVSLVFDYAEFDLAGLMHYKFPHDQQLSIAYQIFDAIAYLHSLNIIHRDIKSSNILLTRNGVVKIADFGLARHKMGMMTNRVCTLWYRAPELLLGSTNYTQSIDMWSIGCVLAELATSKVIFKTEDEITQIKNILEIFGPPKQKFPWSNILRVEKCVLQPEKLRSFYTLLAQSAQKSMFCLISQLLQINPGDRIKASVIVRYPFLCEFRGKYYPLEICDSHEFTSNKAS